MRARAIAVSGGNQAPDDLSFGLRFLPRNWSNLEHAEAHSVSQVHGTSLKAEVQGDGLATQEPKKSIPPYPTFFAFRQGHTENPLPMSKSIQRVSLGFFRGIVALSYGAGTEEGSI